MNKGIGFFGLLQILLIGLKLTNNLTISWWLVFIPTYIWFVLFLGVLFLLVAAKSRKYY